LSSLLTMSEIRPYPSPPFGIKDLDFRDRSHGE
jgi:hypothetical protein